MALCFIEVCNHVQQIRTRINARQMANGYHPSLMTACISQPLTGTPKRNTGASHSRGMFWRRASSRTKRRSTWSFIKQAQRLCGVGIVGMKTRLGFLYLRKRTQKLMAITSQWMVDGQGMCIFSSSPSCDSIYSTSFSGLTILITERALKISLVG